MNKWMLFALAIVCEVSATLLLKAAASFTILYVLVALGYTISYSALTILLKRGVPLGVAYGIWGAAGVALTAILGSWIYGEQLSWLSSVGIVIIIGGIVLVEFGHPREIQVA
ncbi:SMR family transporter [Corynebacterium sp. ES2794-CONJ1]|uniref:DMT family transporter n=1 Tax=unclassified Corynebacterium TaxID=2624378 RepID=UPI002167B57C|nr:MULTISPECIES: SMR family transporter [unclassified Corynebacterium]MCS4490633.1 SMR family transporter [Corynebacterium sp. ES2775-CONJ]MCS4532602.1 SMR family transporter [Corynebacterium sp. ES2730-CONJ]MCU9519997.1 SMR family transporter [Corynebacterium sp. ES2794-CONJ1]